MNSIHMFFFFFPPSPLRGFQSCFRACTCRAAPVVCWIFQELGPGFLTIPWLRAHLINASKSKSHFYLARFGRSGSEGSIRTLTLPSTGAPAASSSAEGRARSNPALTGRMGLGVLLMRTDGCVFDQRQAGHTFRATPYMRFIKK